MRYLLPFVLLISLVLTHAIKADDALESGWRQPPREAKLRNYWWWLNGCVTKEAITHDLEQMAAKGFGGALICDADGSQHDGNDRVPHGHTFMSPQWREMFKHSLKEANRLGLELSVNIQSGWNLGGPHVTADDAGKKLVWTETIIHGPTTLRTKLAVPESRLDYYRDSAVVAYPISGWGLMSDVKATIESSSQQVDAQVLPLITDSDPETFWVSSGSKPGDGPTRDKPEWIQATFVKPVLLDRLTVEPRIGYGPKFCELQVANEGNDFTLVKAFTATNEQSTTVTFEPVTGRTFRLMIYGALIVGPPNLRGVCKSQRYV